MYNKEYADIRIRNHESGKDVYRKQYIEPFLKSILQDVSAGKKVLDVGCGWGLCLGFLGKDVSYCGIEINIGFFDYIKNKFSTKKMDLKYGFLPDNIDVKNGSFDVAICSQVLHATNDMALSLKIIFEKLKSGGELILITFKQAAKNDLIDFFVSIDKLTDIYVSGEYILPSGIKVPAEIYFYDEDEYENEIKKYSSYEKRYIGPLFVAYQCIKK